LDLGFHPDESAAPTDDGGESWGFPLWFAAVCGRHDIAELLLARGADPSSIFAASGDPLGCAEATGDKKMEALLLKHGARITVERLAGSGDLETVRAILDGKIPGHSLNVADPTPADLAAQLLWMAALSSNTEVVQMCLPYVAAAKSDPWWNYVMVHVTSPAVLRLLMDDGVDPNVTAASNYTILHHLATSYHAAQANRVELATILLDAGASQQKRDKLLKSTPLGWACRWGRIDLVKLYLERGADVVESEAEAWATPLAWATKGGHHDIIELLKSHGAT
jgi:ankyrin repeat protein